MAAAGLSGPLLTNPFDVEVLARSPPSYCPDTLERACDAFALAAESMPENAVLRLLQAEYLWWYDIDRVEAAQLAGELSGVLRMLPFDMRHHCIAFCQSLATEGTVDFAELEKAGR